MRCDVRANATRRLLRRVCWSCGCCQGDSWSTQQQDGANRFAYSMSCHSDRCQHVRNTCCAKIRIAWAGARALCSSYRPTTFQWHQFACKSMEIIFSMNVNEPQLTTPHSPKHTLISATQKWISHSFLIGRTKSIDEWTVNGKTAEKHNYARSSSSSAPV